MMRPEIHLANAERTSGAAPAGCEWLDSQTVDDLDLSLVFDRVNRTASVAGAQALWRWLVAPSLDRDTLAARERKIELLADQALHARIAKTLPELADTEAELVPELLWGPPPALERARVALAMFVAVIVLLALVAWNSSFVVPLLLVMSASSVYDMIAQRDLARYAHALEVLARLLGSAARMSKLPLPDELRGTIDEDLKVTGKLLKQLMWLRINDPIGISELVRAAFQVRTLTVHRGLALATTERERLRRVVLWLGELDAARSVGLLRTQPSVRVPAIGESEIRATELVHPALERPVGNDLVLRAGMLITGSNASGKSTFLRTVAINAVLAQSLLSTFGTWSAPLVRVRSAMRINDDITRGMSTYAAEVESVGTLVRGVDRRDLKTLFVLDEPFHGTNPAVRVPIVVAVLEYLVDGHFVMAATHDLDVAHRVSDRFERAHFTDDDGTLDHKLKPGIAPSSNAFAMLQRAGYPAELLARIEAAQARRAS